MNRKLLLEVVERGDEVLKNLVCRLTRSEVAPLDGCYCPACVAARELGETLEKLEDALGNF